MMMENKETINDTISKLAEKKVIRVKEIPNIPLFKTKEEARKMFEEVALMVDKTIKEFKWLPEYDKVINWMVTPDRKGLFLAGNSGRLKTTITNLILPVLYYHVHKLIVRAVNSDKIDESINLFISYPIINIDDIGVEPPVNDFGIKRESVNTLIDFCEKNSKLLIMTSNLSSKQIDARYGTRTLDRIDLLCETIWFNGESLR